MQGESLSLLIEEKTKMPILFRKYSHEIKTKFNLSKDNGEGQGEVTNESFRGL